MATVFHSNRTFGQVLDVGIAFICKSFTILQIRNIRRVRANITSIALDLCIQSRQVLACRIGVRNIVQCLPFGCNRLIVCIDRLASYQLIAGRSNGACADGCSPCIFVCSNVRSGSSSLAVRTFEVGPDVGCIDIGFHAFQFLQLCDVDGIGIVCASSQAGKLTSYFISYFFISVTNGYSCSCGRPCNTIIL